MYQAQPLLMEWCLDCHRAPEKYLRPRAEVFNMNYEAPANQLELGRTLVEQNRIRKMTDCNSCHR